MLRTLSRALGAPSAVVLLTCAVACDPATDHGPPREPDAGAPEPDGGFDGGTPPAPDGGAEDYETRCARFDREQGITRPDGWTARSHCKYAPTDLETMFPADRVARMVIHMTASEYAAMQADLEHLMNGDPSDGGVPPPWDGGIIEPPFDGGSAGDGGIMEPPPDPSAIACEGKAKDDVCEVDWGDGAQPGKCVFFSWAPDVLSCYPDAVRPPPESIAACAGKAEGDACTLEGTDGQCWSDGVDISCFLSTDPDPEPPELPCKDKADGDACTVNGSAEGVCAKTTGPRICQVPFLDEGDVEDVPVEAAAAFWPREPAYFHATIELAGARYESVGVRYKGNNGLSSSRGEKRPMRIKFDEWEDEVKAVTDQRAFGFQDLSLSPNGTDPTNLHQVLAAETFRAHGVPAPHAAFVEVLIDAGEGPRLLGLYAMSELPDDRMAERLFGRTDGHRYKPDGRGAHFVSYVEGSMHPKGDTDFADVKAFVAALHASQTDRDAYRQNLRAAFDMDAFATFFGVNQAIANWDTVGMLAHNFYLLQEGEGGRLVFVPWDFDLSFDGSGGFSLAPTVFDGRWPLLQALARDVEWGTRYADALSEFAQSELATGKLKARAEALAAMVRPVVEREDAVREGALAEFDGAQPRLLAHFEDQARRIAEYTEGVAKSRDRARARLLRRLVRGPGAAERLRALGH